MARKRREPVEFIPKAPIVDCRCKCPTCKQLFIKSSDKLDPNCLNYEYCSKHIENRHRDEDGWKLSDCVDKYGAAEITETDLIVINQEKENIIRASFEEATEGLS